MNSIVDDIIEQFPEIIQIKTINRGDYLISAGSIEKFIYKVDSGAFKISYQTAFEEHIIRFAYKNSVFTSVDSFIHNQPTAFYIQAIKKSRIKCVPKDFIKNYIATDIHRLKQYSQLLEALVLQQMEREIDLLVQSPVERYKRVLSRSPQVFQEIPHKHIAAYLRMTPETLSRLKKS